MKDKAVFKKWWFWVVVVVIALGGIGAVGQSGDNDATENDTSNSTTQEHDTNASGSLPELAVADYEGKEGLVVYKELKARGYTVDAEFENEALTDINGKASDVFDPLDENNDNDRQSVDAFIVDELEQNGDSIKLVIVKSSN